MTKTLLFATLLILPFFAATAAATTHACIDQTTLGASACAQVGTFHGGDGSCSSGSGSWRGGGAWLGIGLAGTRRGIAVDNACYAFVHQGDPYEGSQVALHAWEDGPSGYNDRGYYLNSGTYHGQGGDHRYCYVHEIDENGEAQDGLRIECPVAIPVPVLLTSLP